jgi:hypothetical protein
MQILPPKIYKNTIGVKFMLVKLACIKALL